MLEEVTDPESDLPGSYTATTFLGMAHFSRMSDKLTFLDSAASQTSLTLAKANYYTVAMLSGGEETSNRAFSQTIEMSRRNRMDQHYFFDHASMRLNQVDFRKPEEQIDQLLAEKGAVGYMQYVGVVFTLGRHYDARTHSTNIPLGSVRVGRGTRARGEDTVWSYACDHSNSTAIWKDTKTAFGAALAPPCAPTVTMCRSTTTREGSVVFWIPLGDSFFDPQVDTDDHASVFVDMVVSVSGGSTGGSAAKLSTRFLGQMFVEPGAVLLHCEEGADTANLPDITEADRRSNAIKILLATLGALLLAAGVLLVLHYYCQSTRDDSLENEARTFWRPRRQKPGSPAAPSPSSSAGGGSSPASAPAWC